MTTQYAQGGYIPTPPEGSVPIQLSRGHALISLKSYRALTPEMRRKLFGESDVEIVFTADEAREYGEEALAKLQAELDGREDPDGL